MWTLPTKIDPQVRQLATEVGEVIRAARQKAGLSQAALASAVGMTRTNFARVESGRTNVTIETLLRVAEGLGLTVAITMRARPASQGSKTSARSTPRRRTEQ